LFPKESDESKYNKVFSYCPASVSECWNNMGAMLNESLKEGLKIAVRLCLCGISLDKGGG